jgi:autonomous glycyl radical cofactor GrcA
MTKRERKRSIEALIIDLKALPQYHEIAARHWVGWDKWNSLTPEQQRNNIALAAQHEEVRHACLDVYM